MIIVNNIITAVMIMMIAVVMIVPIKVTLVYIVTDVNDEHPQKARPPNDSIS